MGVGVGEENGQQFTPICIFRGLMGARSKMHQFPSFWIHVQTRLLVLLDLVMYSLTFVRHKYLDTLSRFTLQYRLASGKCHATSQMHVGELYNVY